MTEIMESRFEIPGSFMQENAMPQSSFYLTPSPDDSPDYTQWPRSTSRAVYSTEQSEYSRKRQRLQSRDNTYSSRRRSQNVHPTRGEAASPPLLVNTDYRFKGGLDTPTGVAATGEDAHDFDYEADCRPNRYSKPPPPNSSNFPQTPDSQDRSSNKRRLTQSPNGWGKAVWALTGGMAGKVFNFCWNTTFKGFHAGGGDGYKFDIGTPDVAARAATQIDSKEDVFHSDYNGSRRRHREYTPVPGGFPEQPELIEDYKSQSWVHHMIDDTPTAKVSEKPSHEVHNSWVLVEDPRSASREKSPVRKKSRASTANLYARPLSRESNSLSRPRHTPRSSSHRSSASYASPRASLNGNTASSTNLRRMASSANADASNKSTNISLQQKHPQARRTSIRASMPSPRRQSSQVASLSTSPHKPSPEVRKFEQKMRRKEAKQDDSMNRFNAQLQAMIREGQEALGSKIEVDVEGDAADEDALDEGYEEGGFDELLNKGWTPDDQDDDLTRTHVRPGLWS